MGVIAQIKVSDMNMRKKMGWRRKGIREMTRKLKSSPQSVRPFLLTIDYEQSLVFLTVESASPLKSHTLMTDYEKKGETACSLCSLFSTPFFCLCLSLLSEHPEQAIRPIILKAPFMHLNQLKTSQHSHSMSNFGLFFSSK